MPVQASHPGCSAGGVSGRHNTWTATPGLESSASHAITLCQRQPFPHAGSPNRCFTSMCIQTTASSSWLHWRPPHGRTSKMQACCCRRTSLLCRTVSWWPLQLDALFGVHLRWSTLPQRPPLLFSARAAFHLSHTPATGSCRTAHGAVTIAKTSKLQGWGKKGHGRGGGGKGHGGHGRGHGRGSKHERHDWRADRRDERRAKQQRLEMQAADEEALAGMDWGRGEEGGNGGSGGSGEGTAQMVANQPAEGDTGEAGVEASASAAAAVLPASATEPPSSSNANNNASTAAAAAAATEEEGGEAGEPQDAEPEGGQLAQQAQHGSRKQRQQGESAGEAPTHHIGGSWRQIDAEAWAQHVAIQGGSVVLGELQLCVMQVRAGACHAVEEEEVGRPRAAGQPCRCVRACCMTAPFVASPPPTSAGSQT